MSPFTQSGHSNIDEIVDLTGRFRPEADVYCPIWLIGARVQLTDENPGEN